MYEYFLKKLKDITLDIDRSTQDVIKAATDGNIDSINKSVERLREHKRRKEEFSKDAVLNLVVGEVLPLITDKLIDEYTASHAYQYTKAISVNERDALVKISYHFKSAKIK